MKYQAIDSSLFIQNRKKFAEQMTQSALAVFNSNDLMPTNADGLMPFRQNNDLLYLSGIDQEETILVLFPDHPDEKFREILFLRETNEHIAVWEGHKFTKEEARQSSGIQTVYWLSEFHTLFNTLMGLCEAVYLNSNEHDRALVEVETRDARFIRWCMQKYPLHRYERAAPIMQYLRAVKSDLEIELIKIACGITEKGFRRVLKFVKPGVTEYEIEAEYIHEFIRNRSRGFAYTPIIASGANACVLHYIENNQVCQDGDVLLMDVAAEYANYASDMTRAIPVSGRFTPRQRDVYEAVLRVMDAAKDMLVEGNLWFDYHKAVGEVMEKELVDLGLITMNDIQNQDPDKPAYKKYFMHGTSHHLGLDVHDLGHKYRKFENGMVFTCEPGIYIPEEGLGIRLENNVVIHYNACIDLMENIPLDPDEIEDLMNN
ncbi:MAG: aminopeptidase P family protein [Microscillaceae bacterium]|nr:aminopeptidase P family protein [Microscillaceae bacterium]